MSDAPIRLRCRMNPELSIRAMRRDQGEAAEGAQTLDAFRGPYHLWRAWHVWRDCPGAAWLDAAR